MIRRLCVCLLAAVWTDYVEGRSLRVERRVTPLEIDFCSPQSPCGKCVGHCYDDDDCADGLACFLRPWNGPIPPGCTGSSPTVLDFCYDPLDATTDDDQSPGTDPNIVDPTPEPTPEPTLPPTPAPLPPTTPNPTQAPIHVTQGPTPAGAQYYMIVGGGGCIEPNPSSPFAELILGSCDDVGLSSWRMGQGDSGALMIHHRMDDRKCIQVGSGGAPVQDGTSLRLDDCNATSPVQQFRWLGLYNNIELIPQARSSRLCAVYQGLLPDIGMDRIIMKPCFSNRETRWFAVPVFE